MQELLLFFMTFLFVFLIYQIFVIRRVKSKKRKVKKEPIEVLYLEKKYKSVQCAVKFVFDNLPMLIKYRTFVSENRNQQKIEYEEIFAVGSDCCHIDNGGLQTPEPLSDEGRYS